VVPFTCISLIC